MTCQQIVETTTEYLEGALPESVCRQWESHTAACQPCARYVAQIRMTIRLLGQLAGNAPSLVSR